MTDCEKCDLTVMEIHGCLDGDWYGLCEHPNCSGFCEYEGPCDCECHR